MSDDIYAQHGPFGKEAAAEADRLMDELSPEQLSRLMTKYQALASKIDKQRESGTRPKPSDTLVGTSFQPSLKLRQLILDLAAEYADMTGELSRNDQCVPFACYVRAMLTELGLPARVAVGKATYEMNGVKHEMWHAWVETGRDLIDGNADSFEENLMIPDGIRPVPYWGPKRDAPDRVFRETRELPLDHEVVEIDPQILEMRTEVIQRFREQLSRIRREA